MKHKKISYSNLLTAIGGDRAAQDIADDWTPLYHGADTYKVTYQNDNHSTLHVFLGVYTAQTQGSALINDLNSISDGKIWWIRHQRAKSQNIGQQKVLEQLLEKADGTKRLVWYWYRVAGHDTVNKYEAKVLQLKGAITGSKRASVIAIATKLESDVASARQKLNQFIVERQISVNLIIDGAH